MLVFYKKLLVPLVCFLSITSTSYADNRDIKIYVASAEVVMNEVRGVSKQLNILVDSWANATSGLRIKPVPLGRASQAS